MPPTPPIERFAADASLHLVAAQLSEAYAHGMPACLVHMAGVDASGFDLGVKPLDGEHPNGLLIGFDAPDDWHALGVVVGGWARRFDGSTKERARAHTVNLVSRSGEHASRTVIEGDPELSDKLTSEAPVGETMDLLRRCLGLPTPPPEDPVTLLWASIWLSTVVVDRLTRWKDIARAHPIMQMAAWAPPGALVQVCEAAVDHLSWTELRLASVHGTYPVEQLRPSDAAWLDDGAFARWVLNRAPRLSLAYGDVSARLHPSVLAQVDAVLAAQGLDPGAFPDWRTVRGDPRTAA